MISPPRPRLRGVSPSSSSSTRSHKSVEHVVHLTDDAFSTPPPKPSPPTSPAPVNPVGVNPVGLTPRRPDRLPVVPLAGSPGGKTPFTSKAQGIQLQTARPKSRFRDPGHSPQSRTTSSLSSPVADFPVTTLFPDETPSVTPAEGLLTLSLSPPESPPASALTGDPGAENLPSAPVAASPSKPLTTPT